MMILNGYCHPDFGQVADTLIKMMPQRKNPEYAGGASLCVYHRGEKVVDVWGGTKDRNGTPWEEDTIVFSASTTKGVTSTLMHLIIDKGLAKLDDPISKHWPEFGANGKENITIRQALNHQAGLYNIGDYNFADDDIHDWHTARDAIANAAPAHEPGRFSAYHGLTYGHIIGGLIEHITGKSFQQVLKEELTEPLGLDGLFIGVPDNDLNRLAQLITFNGQLGEALRRHHKIPAPLRKILNLITKAFGADFSHFARALAPDFLEGLNVNDPKHMQAVIPAANGAFTARSLARMYAALANGGELDGRRIVSEETVNQLKHAQVKSRDKVLVIPMGWSLGYHKVFALNASAPNAFGHFGFGGSGAWCDPTRNLSMAMTLNTGVGTPTGDVRTARISGQVIRCAHRRDRWPIKPVATQENFLDRVNKEQNAIVNTRSTEEAASKDAHKELAV
ncbi:MAG: beta-lactamase family protein [Pseudomonadales bacterium]|nr:beta-lactamase family protein [Pseudomonadales bacterium]